MEKRRRRRRRKKRRRIRLRKKEEEKNKKIKVWNTCLEISMEFCMELLGLVWSCLELLFGDLKYLFCLEYSL